MDRVESRSRRPSAAALVASLAVVAAVAAPRPARAWSPMVHQRITSEAIDTLPKGLKPFYKDHRLELPALALDAPPPTEDARDRRFEVDRLLAFPFTDVPRTEAALAAKYPEAAPKVGRLPWLVDDAYRRLVEAFKEKDKGKILAVSDEISGYVSDLHNPLALTENADGQKTGQPGLWVRFSQKLPEAMDKRLKLSPEVARYLDDPKGYVFDMVEASYIWIDNLLFDEDLARRGQSGYTELYYDALAGKAGVLLRNRLSDAVTDVGSYWYTAWTAAGRPELK